MSEQLATLIKDNLSTGREFSYYGSYTNKTALEIIEDLASRAWAALGTDFHMASCYMNVNTGYAGYATGSAILVSRPVVRNDDSRYFVYSATASRSGDTITTTCKIASTLTGSAGTSISNVTDTYTGSYGIYMKILY